MIIILMVFCISTESRTTDWGKIKMSEDFEQPG